MIVDHGATQQQLVAEIPEVGAAGEFEDLIASRLELRAAVQSLPERDREFIALRFGADLTATQIARILGLRTNTVEVALHRALATLRRSLEAAAQEASTLTPLHRVL